LLDLNWMRPALALLVVLVAAPAEARPIRAPRGTPATSRAWAALESPAAYCQAFRGARELLEQRPGLVRLRPDLTTLVIPDLHARRDFLDAVLATPDPQSGQSYGHLLAAGRVQVLCLGDVMHSERRGELWRRGMTDAELREELGESLGTLKRLAELKLAHPEHFHFLRGNHDDLGPVDGPPGDLPLQITRTRAFVSASLGEPLRAELARLFTALPIAAVGKGFVASHADPMFPVSRAEVEARSDRAAVALTRTRTRSFGSLRRTLVTRGDDVVPQTLARLADDPGRDLYLHGHLWASPMTVEGRRVYFGHPRDSAFLRLDPEHPRTPWEQLFEAGSGRKITVPAPAR